MDQIVNEHEFCITAAPEHTFCQNHIGGTEHNDKTDGIHQLVGNDFGFVGNVVGIDYRCFQQCDNACGQNTHSRTDQQKGNALALGTFHILLTQSLGGNDAAGVGHTADEDGMDLVKFYDEIKNRGSILCQEKKNN